ncbi:MAG: glutaredoxin family protein [Halioglobus sp.]|nr:glutaredoxin family protein [Halioglobus sp.]
MKVFRLYGTSACHLCEQAEGMLVTRLVAFADTGCEQVDIAESDELFERYGLRIPVLQHPDGRELGWPFTDGQLQAFLAS